MNQAGWRPFQGTLLPEHGDIAGVAIADRQVLLAVPVRICNVHIERIVADGTVDRRLKRSIAVPEQDRNIFAVEIDGDDVRIGVSARCAKRNGPWSSAESLKTFPRATVPEPKAVPAAVVSTQTFINYPS